MQHGDTTATKQYKIVTFTQEARIKKRKPRKGRLNCYSSREHAAWVRQIWGCTVLVSECVLKNRSWCSGIELSLTLSLRRAIHMQNPAVKTGGPNFDVINTFQRISVIPNRFTATDSSTFDFPVNAMIGPVNFNCLRRIAVWYPSMSGI